MGYRRTRGGGGSGGGGGGGSVTVTSDVHGLASGLSGLEYNGAATDLAGTIVFDTVYADPSSTTSGTDPVDNADYTLTPNIGSITVKAAGLYFVYFSVFFDNPLAHDEFFQTAGTLFGNGVTRFLKAGADGVQDTLVLPFRANGSINLGFYSINGSETSKVSYAALGISKLASAA